MNTDRLVDEMALTLVGIVHLDETLSIHALMQRGFRAAEIAPHLDEVLALARQIRADIARNSRPANHA